MRRSLRHVRKHTVRHLHPTVEHLGQRRAVRDDDEHRAGLARDGLQQFADGAAEFFESRLPVGSSHNSSDGRFISARATATALPLAAGEFAGQVLRAAGQADSFEKRRRAGCRRLC